MQSSFLQINANSIIHEKGIESDASYSAGRKSVEHSHAVSGTTELCCNLAGTTEGCDAKCFLLAT